MDVGEPGMDADEQHGLFQFEFGDDLFDQGPQRQRHFIDRNYVPRETVSGWFCDEGEQVAERFKDQKQGPNMHGLDLCQQWLAHNSGLGPAKFKENDVLEVASRCCRKLDRAGDALAFIERIPEWRDPGIMFVKGELCRMNGRLTDAVACMLDYLDNRIGDYTAWIELSRTFRAMAQQDTNRPGLNAELDVWAVEMARLRAERDTLIDSSDSTYSEDALVRAGLEPRVAERLKARLLATITSHKPTGHDADDDNEETEGGARNM
ncbi:hypothetical protein BC831DRAFT_453700 [Entophlyctis helioformis]|nr:hypothetical protein BC831DRAFT_453700 [Entophlyctis helioformis]